jgi:hypothetical protein
MRSVGLKILWRPMIALLALLLTVGVASAVTNDLTIDSTADLSSNRAEVTLTGTIECTKGVTDGTANITVHIYQSVGRLLNIGIGSLGTTPVNCSGAGSSDPWQVTVSAIPGLKFQPGPATAVITVDTSVDSVPDTTSTEQGAKIKLQP